MATFHQSAYSRTRPSVRGPTPPIVIGILLVGAGRCIAFVRVKCSPAKSNGSPLHSPRRIAKVSPNRVVRSGPPAVLTPNVSSSAGIEPEPMPSSKRPPEAWSSDLACSASIAGWRRESHNTRWPTLSVVVWASTQPAIDIASHMGWSGASGGTT